ncbi:MAG: hypothetical protein JWO32_3082 [Bacteroidetes bacterium]|nr:hypothetical protein [Bacteroidota bacterium]
MDSKIQYIENLRRRGFTENFTTSASYTILTDHKKIYEPRELKISSFYTYSAETDPKDYSVLYAIETIDGKKGILIEDHCESPDEKVENFINSIKTARQNHKKHWFINPIQKMFKVKFSMNL